MTRASGAEHRVTFQVMEQAGADAAAVRTFGERLARVAHPAVPRLRDVFVLDGHAVHVTEEIDGRSLEALIAERPVPARALFEIGAQLAGALEAVHQRVDRATGTPLGIRHEGLGPEFVFVDRHGTVKLLGIGARRGDDARARSPERLLAQEEGLEADVFALATVLYEAAAQTPLFEGHDASAIRAVVTDPLALRELVRERIEGVRERLGSERAAALLRAMMVARRGERPTMAQVTARCDLISDSVEAATLLDFARSRVPAAPRPAEDGRFAGRAFETHGTSLWTLTETPPPPTPRPAEGRRFTPKTSLPPAPSRAPVLGEQEPVVTEPRETHAVAGQGPMPWSPAETVALFERTPSLAPPRELQPIVVDPLRIPQLIRQQWDDGVARRYKLAQMAEHLHEEIVDEETPTLVVRDEDKPAEARNAPSDPDAPTDRVDTPPEERTVYDAPEVSEAGAGTPRRPVSAPLVVPTTGQIPVPEPSPPVAPIPPPAFPSPPGAAVAVAGAPHAPEFTGEIASPAPTVVPLTDAGDDAILGSDPGELPSSSLAGELPVQRSGLPVSMIAGVVLGGLLGLVAGGAVLYLFVLAAP
ncbi:MAG: hypothetical protein AAF602_19375 [Myxococcota bacterium]